MNNGMVGARLSTMMFLQFFVWGAWYVSMTGYMTKHGLGDLIGWAYTVGPIAAIISPFFLGMVADRFFATERTLGAMHILGGLALVAVPSVVSAATDAPIGFFHPYVLLLLLHMLCYMPTLGLSNSLAFHTLTNRERQFPLVRVFGTIGWIAGNIAVGGNLRPWGFDLVWITEGDRSAAQFYIAGGAALLLGLYSFTLPHVAPPARGKTITFRQVLGLDALRLLAGRNYLVFMLCSFLICIPLAAYYAFARLFVEQQGFGNATLTMSYGQMSEILFMLLMPLFFVRLGVKWMLLVGMLAWVVRYGLFAGAADAAGMQASAMIVAGILLHGICYDFFFVTGFIYTDRKAGPEIRAQAQGLLVLVTQGLGLGIGAQVMGRVVAGYTDTSGEAPVIDWQSMWLVPCIAAGIVALAFWALFRDDGRAASGDGTPTKVIPPTDVAETVA